ncbi:hypothetical protein [Nocardioides dongkuii]|uniref:hypothetical protein n=1 Tax=Nocardioides dongkuii TaxID=2760089 RepID=UPI0015FCB133|nr:hypothetical protein [Nocardioides dongkuii]
MTPPGGRLRDAVLALLAGGLAAGGGVAVHELWTDLRAPDLAPVGDRVQHAADALRAGDRVYVAPDAHDLVPPELETRLEALADASETPVYLTVWEKSSHAGYGGIWDAVGQLERLVDEEAVFVVYRGPGDGLVDDSLEDPLEGEIPEDFHGDPALRLEEILTAVGETRSGTPDDWDYWGGPGGAVAAGVLHAAGTIPATLVLIGLGRLALRRRFQMVGGWR